MIAPQASASFVANMEDVLEVYQRPRDPQRPLVFLDETTKQMIAETRAPIPAAPGRKARYDCEYERNGVASLFMMFAPLEGWRCVKVADRHAATDYAHVLKELSDTHFPHAAKIALVQDNLSTHTPPSLYAAFPAPQARRLVERFEWHYKPKHGSWLDMAESELAVLATQCLDRRIPDRSTLIAEVAAWQRDRNKRCVKAHWQFTAQNACGKLKTLYPQFPLKFAVRNAMTMVISGGTSSGKKTFLNALLREVPTNERVISIEDTRELRPPTAQPSRIARVQRRPGPGACHHSGFA